MSKKFTSLFLIGLAFFSLIFFSSCEKNLNIPDGTTGSGIDTQKTEETTTGTTDIGWQPDVSCQWNYTPCWEMDTDISDCDIEFTIEQSVYSEMPDILSCTAVNKAGTPFYCCFSIYIEKRFETVGDQLLDAAPVWVRIPFYSTPVWYESAKADLTWKVTVSNHLKEEFIFTPGQYRLLFIAEDGPHYAYFEITG